MTKFEVNTSLFENLKNKVTKAKDKAHELTTNVEAYKTAADERLEVLSNEKYFTRHIKEVYQRDYYYTDCKYDDDGNVILDYDGNVKQFRFDDVEAFNAAKEKAYRAAKFWYNTKINSYRNLKAGYGSTAADIEERIGLIDTLMTTIDNAITGIEEFQLDMNQAKEHVNQRRTEANEFVFNYGEPSEGYVPYNMVDLEFVESYVTDKYGNQVRVYKILTKYHVTESMEELVEVVGSASSNIGGQAVREPMMAAAFQARGLSDQEINELLYNDVTLTSASTVAALQAGAFSVGPTGKSATMDEALDRFYQEQIDPSGHYSRETVQALLRAHDSETFSEDEMKMMDKIGSYIVESAGGIVSTGVFSPGVATAANTQPFDLATYLDEVGIQTSLTPSAVATNPTNLFSQDPSLGTPLAPGGGCGGGGGCAGGFGTPYTPQNPILDMAGSSSSSPIITPSMEIKPVVSDIIPTAINANTAPTIDAQAKEIFYSRTPQELATERANAMSAVEEAFNGKNVEEFKSLLKEGGFDDVDIDFIMENKEVAVTAYILASQSKNLTDIANQLAIANDIQNFDTMYDNGLSRMSLENGLSASKLMAEIDDDVVEARNNVRTARTKYNNSVKDANDSIDEANRKKEEMEEIRKRIIKKSGEDTSKWEDDDIEAYNKAIEEYNKANKDANDKYKLAMDNKDVLDQAQEKLNATEKAATEKYMKLQEEQAAQGQNEQIQDVDVQEDVPTVDIKQPDGSTLSTDQIVGDADGNITINVSGNNNTVEQANTVQESSPKSNFVSLEDAGSKSTRGILNPTSNNTSGEVEQSLASDDLLSLFDNLSSTGTISDADRTIDGVASLSSLAPNANVEEPVDLTAIKGAEVPTSTGNSMVDLAENAINQGKQEVNSLQASRLNGLDYNAFAAPQGDAIYTSSTTEEKEPEEVKTRTSESSREVAGVEIDEKDVERHTDGVLVGENTPVASEVSEDGRSLEYVELD